MAVVYVVKVTATRTGDVDPLAVSLTELQRALSTATARAVVDGGAIVAEVNARGRVVFLDIQETAMNSSGAVLADKVVRAIGEAHENALAISRDALDNFRSDQRVDRVLGDLQTTIENPPPLPQTRRDDIVTDDDDFYRPASYLEDPLGPRGRY